MICPEIKGIKARILDAKCVTLAASMSNIIRCQS